MIPDVMQAVEISVHGGPEVLKPVHRPVPVAGHGQILIRVAWAGVNRPDLFQRAGSYAPPPGASDLLGLECSGIVAATGPGVTRWKPGDRVCALLPGGGYAEYATCAADHALPVPYGLDLRAAAALPETAFTVWSNVVMRGGLGAGERFLVHGGSSGIGTMAIQVANALGARVWATAGSPEKCAACAELGAQPINYRDEDFVERMRAEGGADVILDIMGAKYLSANVASLSRGGRLVVIGLQGGVKGELNLNTLLGKNAVVTATSLRFRPAEQKAAIVARVVEEVWPLVSSGAIRLAGERRFGLDDVRAAHEHLESGANVGKVILTM